MNFLCWALGHKWLYNFTWMPNKRICSRCKQKQTSEPFGMKWTDTNNFGSKLGTDEEIIERWR